MISTFLNLYCEKGMRHADESVVEERWNELHEELYKIYCWAKYRTEHYKRGDYKYLQDKLPSIIKTAGENKISASKFIHSDQRNRESNEESESLNSNKDETVGPENLLVKTEAAVVKKKPHRKRKEVDGNCFDYSQKKRKIDDALDAAFLAIIDSIKCSKVDERKVEDELLSWIKMKGVGIAELLEVSHISSSNAFYEETVSLITSVGLRTIISIFAAMVKPLPVIIFSLQ